MWANDEMAYTSVAIGHNVVAFVYLVSHMDMRMSHTDIDDAPSGSMIAQYSLFGM